MTARFSVGNVLATSVRIWARNLPRFIVITGVLNLPEIAWFVALGFAPFRDVVARYHVLLELHPVLLVLPDGGLVVHTCTAAAITHGTLVALAGQPAPIGRGLMTAVRRFFPVIGVSLIVRLATNGVVTVLDQFVGLSRFGELASYGLLLCSGALLSLFYLAVPSATLERRAVIGAIVRAFALARGSRIRVFAIVLVWQVVWWGSFRLTALAVFSDSSAGIAAYRDAQVLFGLISLGRYVLLSSLGLVMAAVTYRSLRDDKEGPAADELVTVFE